MCNRRWVPILILGTLACSVDKDKFTNRLYTCDVTSADSNACGSGYGCSGGWRQLGGADFCAPQCNGTSSVCTATGLSIQSCAPSKEGTCPEGMACIRTNLFNDEGVCLPLRPCSNSEQCPDPVRNQCLSVEADLYAFRGRADVKGDHLICVQGGCASRGAACEPGNTCARNKYQEVGAQIVRLQSAYGSSRKDIQNTELVFSLLPDLCNPNCDTGGGCPPNFVCSSRALPWWKNAFPFCVLGESGTACQSSFDCLVGICHPTRKVCTPPCGTSADCAPFQGLNGDPVDCIDGLCITRNSCDDTHICPNGQVCITGKCSGTGIGSPCVADRDCPALFGLACIAVAGSQWNQCNKRCQADEECPQIQVANQLYPIFMCDSATKVCTPRPCTVDDDCKFGLQCDTDHQVCRPPINATP